MALAGDCDQVEGEGRGVGKGGMVRGSREEREGSERGGSWQGEEERDKGEREGEKGAFVS